MSEATLVLLNCTMIDGVLVLEINATEVRSDEASAQLQREFDEALAQNTPTKVAIGLTQVHKVSSRGFGAIVSLHQTFVRKQGGRIALFGIQPDVRELLDLMRFTNQRGSSPMIAKVDPNKPVQSRPLFEIVANTLDEAIAALNATV